MFLDVTTNKNKRKGKKKKTKSKTTGPFPKHLQTPAAFASDEDGKVDSQQESSSEDDDDDDNGSTSNMNATTGKGKSVFTKFAEQEKKQKKRDKKQPSRRDSSVEASTQSEAGGDWNVIPSQQGITTTTTNSSSSPSNKIEKPNKQSTSKVGLKSSPTNTIVFETEDSRDITDDDVASNDEINDDDLSRLLRRQESALIKPKGKNANRFTRKKKEANSDDENEMIREYKKKSSRSVSIPNFFDFLRLSWRFIKNLDWRVMTIVVVTISVLCALKLGEESYMESRRGGDVIETDLYEVLRVPKSATKRDVERAYRRMSVEWHPDRNPDCPQCLKKFQEISNAYSVLSNKESREMYDKSSSSFTSIDSTAITLTAQNYDELVVDTLNHKVWVIQVYTDLDPLCRHIAPAWEESVLRFGRSVGFARINARTTKDLLSRLPVKVRIFPTIIMMSEGGEMSEIYQNIYQMSASNFRSWIIRHYPFAHQRLYDANAIESFLTSSSDTRPHLIVTSPQPSLPLSIRSQLYSHQDVYQSAHTLIHEAKSLSQSWNLLQPDRYINIARFPPPTRDDQSATSPKPIRIYSVLYNATDEDVATVFRKLRRIVPVHLAFPTSPVLCGNENDPPGSLCLVRVLDSEVPVDSLQFSAPLRPSDDDEDVNDDDEDKESVQEAKTNTTSGGSFSFITEASDRVSTAAQVLMHGAKKVCRFEESEFWGQKGLRRHLKKSEDEDSDSSLLDIERFLQLTYMMRPPQLPRWISKIGSWMRPVSIRHPFFACHDLWGSVLKESDLLIFQRSSGRLLPLQRVETSLTSAVEIAADIFNGFVDIDVSSQLRSLGTPQSKDWRGVDSKEPHSIWDARLLSCGTPITATSILTTMLSYLFASKIIASIVIIGTLSFIWWFVVKSIDSIRERRETRQALKSA